MRHLLCDRARERLSQRARRLDADHADRIRALEALAHACSTPDWAVERMSQSGAQQR